MSARFDDDDDNDDDSGGDDTPPSSSSSSKRSPMARFLVESYQKLKKWYLMPPCLTPNLISCVSGVKWSNPGKEVLPSPTPRCSSYWKGILRVSLDYSHQLDQLIIISNFLWTCCIFVNNIFNAKISAMIYFNWMYKVEKEIFVSADQMY